MTTIRLSRKTTRLSPRRRAVSGLVFLLFRLLWLRRYRRRSRRRAEGPARRVARRGLRSGASYVIPVAMRISRPRTRSQALAVLESERTRSNRHIPHVYETTHRGERAWDPFSRLLKDRITIKKPVQSFIAGTKKPVFDKSGRAFDP